MASTSTVYGAELLAPGWTANQLCQRERIRLAVQLYQQGLLSTGAAAEFARVPKPLFLTRLAEHGVVTFDLSEQELRAQVDSARRHL